jgi:hypothetical protein
VSRASAVVPGAADAEPIIMHTDHINMVKFRSRSDEGYKKVSDYIQIMAREAPDKVGSRWEKEGRVKEGTQFLYIDMSPYANRIIAVIDFE